MNFEWPWNDSAIGVDLYNQTLTGGVSKTLNSVRSDSDHVPCVLVLNDQGGGVMSVSYDVTSTLREQTKHHEPVVLVYDSHGQDARYRDRGETCETISAKYGLGGAMHQSCCSTEEPRSYCVTSHGSYAEGIGTLRACGGDIGGGSEVLVVEMVLASIAPNAERTDGTISPTLMHRAGTGGANGP